MKGITHFMSGVAVATCFPVAIESVYASKGLLIPLGGMFGIMPDTLDFRIARYIWDYQRSVQLSEDDLDPKKAAEAVAQAIDDAWNTGEMVTLRLDVIRVSSSYYRTYIIYVDDEAKEVTAVIGSLKTMSQVMEKLEHMPSKAAMTKSIAERGVAATYQELFEELPCLPGTAPTENNWHTAKFEATVQHTYYRETEIGIFSGPDFAFHRSGDEIRIDFIPWHRTWSHSLTMGLVMGPIAFALTARWELLTAGDWSGWLASGTGAAFFIGILAFWVHVFEDQLGHLGSNLFWPFTKFRTVGMKLSTAASPVANISTNWLAFSIIIWNLNANAPTPAFTLPYAENLPGGFADWNYYLASLGVYVLLTLVLPFTVFNVWKHLLGGGRRKSSALSEYDDGTLAEVTGFAAEEGDI